MQAQPLIAVHDVEVSSRWYQGVLGCESGHGGSEYEQIMHKGKMLLQIHRWDVHEHEHLGNKDAKPYGNGMLLWFQTDDFDGAVKRADVLQAKVLEAPRVNPNAKHREFWLQDPDGYVVVIASAYGDLDALTGEQ